MLATIRNFAVTACVAATLAADAVTFDECFADTTVRLDYILGGNAEHPAVSLLSTYRTPRWHGRREHTDRLPVDGNGTLTVTDDVSGDTIYRHSFSTLYSEWLTLGDTVCRAFENSFLMPMPRRKAHVTLSLTDSRHRETVRHTHPFDPADILIADLRPSGYKQVALHTGTYDGPKIGVAILPEGFTAERMDIFMDYARKTVDAIFSHEPFGSMSDRFDFIAVQVPSATQGVSVPKNGEWRDTPFGSHFSTFYSDRYLTAPRVFDMYDAMAGVPAQHIIVLADTDVYGGGGIYNSYTLTTTGNPMFSPVVVHEFGHSFGGLGDEYFYDNDVMTDTYPLDVEPWEPNITTLVNFPAKWQHLLAADTPVPTPAGTDVSVGVFEGGGYSSKGIYRPADVCRMRVNNVDAFCPACQDWLRKLILFYTQK